MKECFFEVSEQFLFEFESIYLYFSGKTAGQKFNGVLF
jgi:hypothetical protein